MSDEAVRTGGIQSRKSHAFFKYTLRFDTPYEIYEYTPPYNPFSHLKIVLTLFFKQQMLAGWLRVGKMNVGLSLWNQEIKKEINKFCLDKRILSKFWPLLSMYDILLWCMSWFIHWTSVFPKGKCVLSYFKIPQWLKNCPDKKSGRTEWRTYRRTKSNAKACRD